MIHQLPDEARGELILLDATGRPVANITFAGGTMRTEFSVASLANGYYRYLVLQDGKAIGQGQLTIIR